MAWRRLIATVLAACGVSAGCHSKTAPSPASSAQPALTFTVTTTATLFRANTTVWQINYLSCFSVQALTPDVAAMTVNRVDYALLDAAGQVYRSFADTSGLNVGHPIGQTPGGCAKLVDNDTARAVSPTFRASIQFGDSQSTSNSRSLDGAVTNSVPPMPFVDSLAVTSDIPGASHFLTTRRPITFTVTQVIGGTPPLLFQFKINNFLMRDWGGPEWVWDAQTLNNAPVVNGGYTCGVYVRQGNYPSETNASTNFILQFPEPTAASGPLSAAVVRSRDLRDRTLLTLRRPMQAKTSSVAAPIRNISVHFGRRLAKTAANPKW